jgi:hypothetical protein
MTIARGVRALDAVITWALAPMRPTVVNSVQLGATAELIVWTSRADGSAVRRPIWPVAVDARVYIRSAFGERSWWYRAARREGRIEIEWLDERVQIAVTPVDEPDLIDRVSAAYRAKYGLSWPGPVETMRSDAATQRRSDDATRAEWPDR